MCGRFSLVKPVEAIQDLDPTLVPDPHVLEEELGATYSIAPTHRVPIVIERAHHRELMLARWGLLPPWKKEVDGPPLINGRADTLAEKPSFSGPFRSRRCLVPATAFFEWQTVGKEKRPKVFTMADGKPFMLAGLWEPWRGPDGVVNSFTLITTEPNELVASVHDRMPVIMPKACWHRWLDPEEQDLAAVQPLLAPYPAERMAMRDGNLKLNHVRNNDPSVLGPPDPPTGQLSLFGS